jgi:hypothetical protein
MPLLRELPMLDVPILDDLEGGVYVGELLLVGALKVDFLVVVGTFMNDLELELLYDGLAVVFGFEYLGTYR